MATTTKLTVEKRQKLDAARDDILEAVENGERINAIARAYGCDRRDLSYWRSSTPGLQADWDEAMEASSDALVESALDDLDSVRHLESMAKVTAARNAAEAKRWLAGRRAKRYDDRPNVHVGDNITNIGQLHLNALRQYGQVTQPHDVTLQLLPTVSAVIGEGKGERKEGDYRG